MECSSTDLTAKVAAIGIRKVIGWPRRLLPQTCAKVWQLKSNQGWIVIAVTGLNKRFLLSALPSSWFARIFVHSIFFISLFLITETVVRVSGVVDHLYTAPAFEVSRGGTYWRYRPRFEGTVLGPTQVRIGPLGARLHGAEEVVPGKAIVAIFGDSIAFGQGVPGHLTFASLLENWLGDAALPGKVLNFGVAGHSLEMELDHLADRLSEIAPSVVVLAFHSDDLSPKRAENHVDRFGYLTKKIFGPPSFWMDWFRAILRESHLVLMAKDSLLRLQKFRSIQAPPPAAVDELLRPLLVRFRDSIKRFAELTANLKSIIVCVDRQDNPLNDGIQHIMNSEFPRFNYVHGPRGFLKLPLITLLVPRDGHPNALAHRTYAELIWPFLKEAVQAKSPIAKQPSVQDVSR
jgi:lysophospholipase L1-like esterase